MSSYELPAYFSVSRGVCSAVLPCLGVVGEGDLVRCGAIVVILCVLNASALLHFRIDLKSFATNCYAKKVTTIHLPDPSLFRDCFLPVYAMQERGSLLCPNDGRWSVVAVGG